MTVIHNLTCGCTHPRPDLILSRTVNKEGIKSCPKHDWGVTVSRYIICVECGTKRDLKGLTGGNLATRCIPCQWKKTTGKDIGWEKKYSSENRDAKYEKYKGLADLDRRASCKYLENVCLDVYDKYEDIPCAICEYYSEQVYYVDYGTRRVV